MTDTNPNQLTFDRLLELLADKLAVRLSKEPNNLHPRLLTVEQTATYLGRTNDAVQHLAASGKIPVVRADRRLFFDRQDLDQWIKDNKVGWA